MTDKNRVNFYTLIEDISEVKFKDRKDENKEKTYSIKPIDRENLKKIYDFIFFEKVWPIEKKGNTSSKQKSVNKSKLYTEIEKIVKPESNNTNSNEVKFI